MTWVARRVLRGLTRLLARRGLGPEADPALADPLPGEDPLLATLYSASVRGRIAMGRRAGQRLLRFGDRVDAEDLEEGASPGCVTLGGLSIHTQVGVPGRDRRRLQRLCRYAGRPPVATERLSRHPDGRLFYRLKRRWRDGTTHVIFEPLEFLEKLAALVPPPRFHQVRYHGILGPAAVCRRLVVPGPRESHSGRTSPPEELVIPARSSGPSAPRTHPGVQIGRPHPASSPAIPPPAVGAEADLPGTGPHRLAQTKALSWAELIRRVFAVDVLQCPRCGGRMRILAAIQSPNAIRAILDHLGLPSHAPPTAADRSQEDPPPGIDPEEPEG